MQYDFTSGNKKNILYKEDESAGFITEENMIRGLRSSIPELNSGMVPAYWSEGYKLTEIEQDEHGCYTKPFDNAYIPLVFACDVANEGNYRVKVKLYSDEDIDDALIFLGRRRLADKLVLKAGEIFEGTYLVNVTPIIPRNHEEAMEDKTVDVTIVGKGLHLMSLDISEAKVGTIYIAGDSTVTDQSADFPYLPELSYCGWGQMLSCFLKEEMAVSNHAHSGLTTNSMRSEGHYSILYDRIAEDDICLIQFGHNDQKLDELKADEGYKDNLNRYIDELLDKGAIPVIVTPLARNSWRGNDGSYNDLLVDYAQVCKKVAADRNITCIDLHDMSMELIKKLGCEESKKYFYPSDYTHSNDYGAYLFASYVYDELCKAGLIKKHPYASWEVFEELRTVKIPEECQNRPRPDEVILFENLERPDDELKRFEAFQMAIETMRFFPTNVYNDMFTDVYGHEVYAGSIECAYQNGMIPDDFLQDNKIFPMKPVSYRELGEVLAIAYKSRKSDSLSPEDIVGRDKDLEDIVTREEAAKICRQLKI